MAEKLSSVKLPNNSEYYIQDDSAVASISRSGTTCTITYRDGHTSIVHGLELEGGVLGFYIVDPDLEPDTDSDSDYDPNANKIFIPVSVPLSGSDTDGLMSYQDYLKLANIESGAEVNQFAFGKVRVSQVDDRDPKHPIVTSTDLDADDKVDTFEMMEGDNVTLVPNVPGDKVTIHAKDTTYILSYERSSEIDSDSDSDSETEVIYHNKIKLTNNLDVTDVQTIPIQDDVIYKLTSDSRAGTITLYGSNGDTYTISVPYAGHAASADYADESGHANLATADADSDTISETYATNIDIDSDSDGHYQHIIQLKNKQGNVIASVEVPDNDTTYTLEASSEQDSVIVFRGSDGTVSELATGKTYTLSTDSDGHIVLTSSTGDVYSVIAPNAEHADLADEALHSSEADYADEAGHSSDADHADLADEALHSSDADHAIEADHSSDADHADLADEAIHSSDADHATNADYANHAVEADHSSEADHATSATYAGTANKAIADADSDDIRTTYAITIDVDRDSDDDITVGLKNKNGVLISTDTVPKATQSDSGLMSSSDKTKLDGIATGAQVNVIETVKVNGTPLTPDQYKAVDVTVPTKLTDLENDSDFVQDKSYIHTDNNYTTTEKNKLAGIASGAEVNQNAFSIVKITKATSASTSLSADSKTDTVEVIEGTNITLTPDASKDKFEISAKDTTYTLSQDPTDGHKFKLTNNLDGTDVQEITIPDSDTTYHVALDSSTNSIMLVNDLDSEDISSIVPADATTTLHGYMSASDKVKLNGIATGAEVNQNAYSTVKVGNINVSSSSKTGTLTLVEGANITLTPNTSDKSVTIASSYTNTTYTLTQNSTDCHKFTLSGTDGYSKTITIPDNNTTYTLAVGTGDDANKLIFTPSSGTATKITVPFATNATNAVNATNDQSGNNIKSSYASSVDISGHTLTLKSKDGTTLSTKTLPDNDTTYTFAEGSTDKAFTVTPKGGTAQTVPIHGLGAASTKGVSSTVTDSDTNLVTGGAVATAIAEAIDNLPEPMIFKGTLGTNGTYTTLPTAGASTEGWTLKVITADTYPTGDSGTPKAKVGDMFICRKISSSSFEWVWIPSGDDVEDTWRGIKVDTVSKLGNGISTGALDFTSGNHIGLSFNPTGNKLTIAHADTSSQASVTNSGRTYIQSVTLDGDGHVTGLTSGTETVVNTDRYVNSASFADDTSSDTDHPVKMTLTRAGSDSVKIEGNIPKVSSTSAGVAPKGASVSTQSQSTKFLREDGSWAKPSYTTNTDRYVNSASFAHDSTNSNMKMTLTRAGSDTKTVTANIPVVSSSTSGVAPKGNAVTTQTTSTKFLREDGSWAAPSYTENTDRYVNSASFADDTTASASSPVKMTLTRAGSDTATVTGNIPKVSSSSAGVAPKGSAVSSQSQSTKFLREDGTWAKPSYTTNTDTKVTAVGNHYTPAKSETKSASSDTATDITNTEGTAVITGIEMDAKGHVTGIVSNKLKSVNTTYSQGTGISISGTTINHSNSVTAGTASEGGTTRTLTFGGTFNVPGVTYDAQGHITSTSSVTLTLPANPNTDTKVTSVGNHYAPSANPSSELSASATGATAAWNIDVVQGVQVQRDAKGHVTGVTVTSGKIPSNPNTDEKVTQTETTSDETYELLFSGTADNTTRTEGARKSGNLTFNPSTGTLNVSGDAYTKAIYLSDSQSTPTQSNRFGWYQWGDQVQFTYRNSQNKYLGQAFAIYVTDGHSEWNRTAVYKANMYPDTTDTYTSGTASKKWKGVYATTFYGDLDGNASSASSAPWSGITDKPSTFPPSAHTHSQIVTVGDKRSTATVPTDYVNALIFQGLKNSSTIGSPSTDSYSYLVGLRGWSDSSGGNSHELAFNNSGVYRRQGATDTWGSWMKLIDSGNYTDYTVKKDGTGASGTWGISITGNAATATSATSATNDSDGNAINTTYLKLSGGTMTGALKFGTSAIPEFSGAPNYLLGIEAFADGGDVKWKSVSNISVGSATTATKDSSGAVIKDTYVKKAGDTMTGVLTLLGGQYTDSYSGALNANNSNIYNLNSIYTADASDGASEGIHFYRDATHVDTLWMSGGDLLFVPNRALGTSTTAANSQKVGRFTANPTSGQVVITDGTTGGMKSSGYTIATSVPSGAIFTDQKVTQTATNTNATYEVLFSGTADNTTRTEGARKYSNLTFNPSTGTLTTTKVVSANATLGVADIDTANITESNVGNLIVTGAARFLNTINGSISGNAATATLAADSSKLNGYASDTSATNNTIARRTANGYIFATYFNQSSGAETPTSSSYVIYANSDGYFRKSSIANMKTAMSLNNVENKSSATIRGEITSANVTTALGYTPVNKAGDTMTGELINQQGGIWVQGGSAAGGNVDRMTLTAGMPTELKYNGGKRGLRLYSNAVAIADPYNGNSNSDAGWIRHIEETSNSSIFEIATGDDGNESIVMRQYNTSSAVAREAKILGADGATSFPVSVTAPKFIGNLQGTADNADKVDGYHVYYDRYVSSTQLAQPTADAIWYVKVSTANWNSNIEVIQIRTGGNNRTGSHVLYTGSRGTKWWGYGQVYSHRGLSGVYKVISNSDDIYLRFDADCTSATIYTSFTPQTLAIVDSPSGANYTEVPTYGGWYGNQITVDHIQTNNYITIQKQTVASSTFADTNPKIVFKNVDGSQSGSLTWCDYDSVQSPASLTLNGTQGGEYFIAPNIKATGNFYGNLSGHASLDLALTGGTMTGKIVSTYNQSTSWLYCGQNPDIHINNTGASGWIGGNTKTGRHVICTYANSDDLLYFNWYSNTTLAGTENKFDKSFTWNPATNILSTNISGNAATATTATSATKATQDESGNNIKASYASSFSISDHTITLKNKNGASLGTVTVPDNNTTYGLSATNDNITLTAGGTGTTVPAHLCYNVAIGNTTDWNTLHNAGAYKVQMSSWGDADTYHSPNKYKSDLYSFGILYNVKSGVAAENRLFQYYIPHNSTTMPLLVRNHNGSSWDSGWSTWYPIWIGISKSDVGLGNVENKSSATIRGEITSSNVTTALGYTPANSTSLANYLPLAGGTMTGQIKTSFKSAIATGSRLSDATTVPDLCTDVRYSSGCCGSVNISTAYTLSGSGVTIGTGWYNYMWIPHRSGGVNGAASGDNCNYGSLYLSGMTMSGLYMVRFASGAIAEVKNLYKDDNTTYGLGTSGNNITIVAGGTTTSVTAPYATSAGSATNDSAGNQISTTYVKKSGDSMTGTLCMNSATGNYAEGIRINAGSGGYSTLTIGTEANSTSGISDCAFWIGTNRTSSSYQRKLYIAHNTSTDSTTYFYASSASDKSPSLQVGGTLAGRGVVLANTANSGTAGGLGLYGTDPTQYGVIFRTTANQGVHGYVTSDWATYFTMSNTDNRGWVFRRQSSGNVASINTSGHMVLNGSLTVGGNASNSSGCRLVYNPIGSLDFVFV